MAYARILALVSSNGSLNDTHAYDMATQVVDFLNSRHPGEYPIQSEESWITQILNIDDEDYMQMELRDIDYSKAESLAIALGDDTFGWTTGGVVMYGDPGDIFFCVSGGLDPEIARATIHHMTAQVLTDINNAAMGAMFNADWSSL